MNLSEIFVFGSNRAGRHGKGAALFAREHHGAVMGQGEGLQGDSYAIPTKDRYLRPLPLEAIAEGIGRFLRVAREHPAYCFKVTPIGCGLAGYRRDEIRALFDAFGELPANCYFSQEWYV